MSNRVYDRSLYGLLQNLIDSWSCWEDHEDFYLNQLLPQLKEDPSKGTADEEKLINEIKSIVSEEDWINLSKIAKQIRNNKEFLETIVSLLEDFLFEEADSFYLEHKNQIDNKIYLDLKNQFIELDYKEKSVSAPSDFESLLEEYCFEEADKFYQNNEKYIDENLYLELKTQYVEKEYREKSSSANSGLETLLSEYCFEEADEFYQNNEKYIDEKVYLELKTQYVEQEYNEKSASNLSDLESLLIEYRFEEAEQFYQENEEYIDDKLYLELREKFISKKIEEEKRQKILARLKYLLSHEGLSAADELFSQYQQLQIPEYVKLREKWIHDYLYKKLNLSLNNEQVEAVGAMDGNVLLKARAGSGKTSVVTAKAYLVIEHENIHPDQIMLLAFNKKAADEMNRRIRKRYGLLEFKNARTFHSLAYQLVQPQENLLFDEQAGGLSNQKQSKLAQRIVNRIMNPVFKEEMYRVFKSEMREIENLGELLSKEDYLLYRRNHLQLTLNGNYVKSLGEKYIGDFLFEHDIKHSYEAVWYWNFQGNYRPDFTLFVNSDTPNIVIEHWGIDENDPKKSVPEEWVTSWQEYRIEMDLKRAYWKDYNLKNPSTSVALIETSVIDLRQGRIHFENILKAKLSQFDIKLQKLSDKELYDRMNMIHLARLTRLFVQYIQKAKKQRLSPNVLKKRIDDIDLNNERTLAFSKMANAVYSEYIDELKNTNSIDFDDLMEKAIDIIKSSNGKCEIRTLGERRIKLNELKWLMVDEYQDFSPLFYSLIETIRENNSDVKLFCVGDDWQAINAFAGSNLCYFTDFKKYISSSEQFNLLTNFRNATNILNLSNKFMRNKGEYAKAFSNTPGKIFKCYTNKVFIEQRHDKKATTEASFDERFITFKNIRGQLGGVDSGMVVGRMLKACHSVIVRDENRGKTFGILSRVGQLSRFYENLQQFRKKLKDTCKDYPVYRDFDKNVRVGTIHSFKGLEADIIILLNVVQGRHPMIHPDEGLFEIFGSTPADILAEEQRLFYVGMTRAKSELYFLTEAKRESEFIKSIKLEEYEVKYIFDDSDENTFPAEGEMVPQSI